MRRWMRSLLGGRQRELPLGKRDLLVHVHVDLLPTRWSSDAQAVADDRPGHERPHGSSDRALGADVHLDRPF